VAAVRNPPWSPSTAQVARPVDGGFVARTDSHAPSPVGEVGPHCHARDFDLDKPLREARDEFEKAYFEYHLARENGSMTRVAEKTGWSAPTCTASSSNWAWT
jgi:DNA-binding NtrC family response regulator